LCSASKRRAVDISKTGQTNAAVNFGGGREVTTRKVVLGRSQIDIHDREGRGRSVYCGNRKIAREGAQAMAMASPVEMQKRQKESWQGSQGSQKEQQGFATGQKGHGGPGERNLLQGRGDKCYPRLSCEMGHTITESKNGEYPDEARRTGI